MSMKILNICLTVLITGACALSAHAQKQLRYLPQAVKAVPRVPYAVSPRLSPVVRAQFAMPTVRPQAVLSVHPNVSAAVERAVAAKVTVQERLARLEKNLKALEEYARTHDNKLPPAHIDTEDSNLRLQVIKDINSLKRTAFGNHPLFQRYKQLVAAESMQPTVQERLARLEQNLNQLEEYAHAHDNKLPQTYSGSLRQQVLNDIAFLKGRNHLAPDFPLFERYNQLLEKHNQQIAKEQENVRTEQRERRRQDALVRAEQEQQVALARAEQREQDKLAREEQQQREEQLIQELRAQEQAAEQRAWEQVLLQDATWKAQPEEMADPAENAKAAARLVEEQIVTPQTITDDYINQLLQFYNKLDPMGTGTIQ